MRRLIIFTRDTLAVTHSRGKQEEFKENILRIESSCEKRRKFVRLHSYVLTLNVENRPLNARFETQSTNVDNSARAQQCRICNFKI